MTNKYTMTMKNKINNQKNVVLPLIYDDSNKLNTLRGCFVLQ